MKWLKSKASGLFGPAPGIFVPKHRIGVTGHVVVVLTSPTGATKTIETHNIVTDAGDLYYAERAVADLNAGTPVPTNFTDVNGTFDGIMELYTATGSAAPAKGNDRSDLGTLITDSDQGMDSGYPTVNDSDPNNTGAGTDVATYHVSYATGDANGSDIGDVIITNPSPGATEALLMHAEFASTFEKTSTDTLDVFVNHTFNGI